MLEEAGRREAAKNLPCTGYKGKRGPSKGNTGAPIKFRSSGNFSGDLLQLHLPPHLREIIRLDNIGVGFRRNIEQKNRKTLDKKNNKVLLLSGLQTPSLPKMENKKYSETILTKRLKKSPFSPDSKPRVFQKWKMHTTWMGITFVSQESTDYGG
jgi:hypothetical protein